MVNILGGHSIGHPKQKECVFYGMTNRCNNVQWVYFSASPLYMFRAVHTPIIRSTGLTVSTVIDTIIGQAQIVSGTASQCSLVYKIKRVCMYMCPIPNGFQDFTVELQNFWQERYITYCIYYRYLLFKWQIWYSLHGTIYFRKFERPHQCTLQLVWGQDVLRVRGHTDLPLCGR